MSLALVALSHAPFAFDGASRSLVAAEDVVAEDVAADAEATIQVEDSAKIQVEDSYSPPENAEHFKFEAEVSRMLDIVVNSLYQNKDVFLRELISNASDALDKIRFLSLTKPEYLAPEEKLEVQIEYDPTNNYLIIRDTGIGMTHDEMVSNLGTVARSGTTKFMQALQDKNENASSGEISQIGQFGVGFYSAFLVSDRIQVASKHPDSDVQYIWTSSNGASEFTVFADPRGTTLTRGTEITLFLKEDCVEYADQNRLRELAKHYSEFVVHPIRLRTIDVVDVEVEDEEEEKKEPKTDEDDLEVSDEEDAAEVEEKPKKTKEVTTYEWEILNGNPAIWTRSKEDITDAEYQDFWKIVSKDESSEAEIWTHFNAEGNINFKSILYLPSEIPERYRFGNNIAGSGINLYVRKVLISHEFDLLPTYLGFISGVVDSDDLPLNVNRESLQESKIIQVIKKKVVRKALDMIRLFVKESEEEMEAEESKEETEDDVDQPKKENRYIKWYEKFAPSLKMGAMEDEPNRPKLMKLLRYKSSKSGDDWVGLEKYIDGMKDWQKEIYYIAAVDKDAAKKSQFLEPFHEKGVEVLYFTDTVDEYMIQQVRDYSGKKFLNIASEAVKFDDEEDKDLTTRRTKYYKDKFKPLTKWLKKLYGPAVMRVVISKRLGKSPAIASSSEHGHSANMERIMRAQAFNHGQNEFAMKAMKILEINPRHPLVIKLLEGCPQEDDEEAVISNENVDAAWILHEMALLNGGFPLTDPEGHTKRLTRYLQSTLEVDSLALAAEPDLTVLEEEAPEVDEGPKGSSPEDAIPLTPDEFGNIGFDEL
jgi:heat shock protein beta